MTRPAGAPSFVVQRPGSLHLEIDAGELARTFAGELLPDETRGNVVGPWDLHVLNALRQRHGVGGAGAIPADLFVWATGEPPHRAMTKLGGAPYLPASARWPQRDGTTGDFYAQLNFADSRDLVPPLPGDVLLVFCFHALAHTSWDEELYDVPPPPRAPEYDALTNGPGDGITCLYLDAFGRVRVHFSCA